MITRNKGPKLPSEPRVYGEPLTGLFSLLRNLRLDYKDVNKHSISERYIFVRDFGLQIVVPNSIAKPPTGTAKVMVFNPLLEKDINDFGENLMWYLIEHGYMLYIKYHLKGVNGRIYRQLLTEKNWGRRIIEKRLEILSNKPEKHYLYKFTKMVSDEYSTSEIMFRFPGFFDFLA